MNATTQTRTASYAPRARRDAYIDGMRKIAAERQPGPVRVYLSAPLKFLELPNWDKRLDTIRALLPEGVELLDYPTTFGPEANYLEEWTEFAGTLDGLVVAGRRLKPNRDREYTLGHAARKELITLVGAGKPVLLHSMQRGLVPVLDCHPERTGTEPHQRLKLTIPKAWSPEAATLHAALDALMPAGTDEGQPAAHLDAPFAVRT